MFEDEEDKDRKKGKKKRDFKDVFEEIQKMMENMFNNSDFLDNFFDEEGFPKFKTPSGDDFFRPIVMGWSVNIGPDGKPVFTKFGHTPKKNEEEEEERPINESREPLIDILNQDNEIVIVIETPGVEKKDIKLKTTKNQITIEAGTKFKKILSLPEEVIPEKSKASYNNGLLEVRLIKRNKKDTEETTINID
ncbi:MAG: Hsp20/alpha crystallin family protein [Candidatus Helarchaeota archaeon]